MWLKIIFLSSARLLFNYLLISHYDFSSFSIFCLQNFLPIGLYLVILIHVCSVLISVLNLIMIFSSHPLSFSETSYFNIFLCGEWSGHYYKIIVYLNLKFFFFSLSCHRAVSYKYCGMNDFFWRRESTSGTFVSSKLRQRVVWYHPFASFFIPFASQGMTIPSENAWTFTASPISLWFPSLKFFTGQCLHELTCFHQSLLIT